MATFFDPLTGQLINSPDQIQTIIDIQETLALEDLTDVDATVPTDGQTLSWDQATTSWKPKNNAPAQEVDTTTVTPTVGKKLGYTGNSKWEPVDTFIDDLNDVTITPNSGDTTGTSFELTEPNGNPNAESGGDWGVPNNADGIFKSGEYSYKGTYVWTPLYLPDVLPLNKQYDCMSSWIYANNTASLTIFGNKDTQRGWSGNGIMLYKNSNTYTVRGTSLSTDKVVATSLATNTWHHFYVQVNYANGRANKPEISLWINGNFIANWPTSDSWNWAAPTGTWCDSAGFRIPGDTVPAVGGTEYRDRFYFKQLDSPIVGMTDSSFVVADVEAAVTESTIKDSNTLIYNLTLDQWVNGDLTIDNLSDVDTSTVAPTDGQVLAWDNANSQWKPANTAGGGGGATGGGSDAIFYENDQTVTTDYTITINRNAISAGPVSIDPGVTVTIPSGSNWVIV